LVRAIDLQEARRLSFGDCAAHLNLINSAQQRQFISRVELRFTFLSRTDQKEDLENFFFLVTILVTPPHKILLSSVFVCAMKRHRVAYSTATSETQRSDEDQGEEKEDEKKRKVVSDDEKERVDEDVDGSGDEPRNDDDEDQDEGEGEGESDNDGDVSENEDGNEINEKGGGGDSSSTCARCLASSDKSIANKPNAERLELMERVTHLEVDELQGIIGKLNVNTLRSLVLRALAGEASLEDDEKKVVGTLSSSGTSSSSSRMGRPVTAALVTYESAIKTKTSRLTKQVVLEVAALPRLPSSTWSYVFQYLAFCDMVAVHQVSRTARRLVCHPASWYHVRLEATVHLAWLLRFVPQLVQRARAVYCTDSYNERYAAGPAGLGSSGSVAPLLARVWLTQAKGLPNTLRELRLTTFFKVAFSLNGSTWRPALLNYTRVSDAADNQDVDGARVSTHWPHLCALELDVDDAPPYARVAFREFTKIASLTKLVLRHPPVAVMCPQDAPVLSGDEKEASPGVVCTIPSRFEWLEIIGWQCRVASSVTDDGSSSSSTSGDDVVSCLRVLRTGSGTCASISRIASWPPSLTHLAVGDLMSNPTFSQSANVMTTSTSDPPKHPSALVTPPSHIASMQFDAFAKSLPVLGYLLLEDVTLRDPSHWTILSSLVTLTRIDIINGNVRLQHISFSFFVACTHTPAYIYIYIYICGCVLSFLLVYCLKFWFLVILTNARMCV
jgi:hypothetical protein